MADTMGGEACTGEYVADGVVKLPPSVYVRWWGREKACLRVLRVGVELMCRCVWVSGRGGITIYLYLCVSVCMWKGFLACVGVFVFTCGRFLSDQ